MEKTPEVSSASPVEAPFFNCPLTLRFVVVAFVVVELSAMKVEEATSPFWNQNGSEFDVVATSDAPKFVAGVKGYANTEMVGPLAPSTVKEEHDAPPLQDPVEVAMPRSTPPVPAYTTLDEERNGSASDDVAVRAPIVEVPEISPPEA